MELKEKAISLAEELGIDFGEVHRVIGVSASTLEAAFNGHKKAVDSVTKFFTDREPIPIFSAALLALPFSGSVTNFSNFLMISICSAVYC